MSRLHRGTRGILSVITLVLTASDAPASEATSAPAPVTPMLLQLAVDGVPHCIATPIARQLAITALHCVQPAQAGSMSALRLTLRSAQGDVYRVQKIITAGKRYQHLGELHGHDLALLQTDLPFQRWSLLAVTSAAIATPLYAYLLRGDEVSTVRLSLRDTAPREFYAQRFSVTGDSGAPVLTHNGVLVGVTSWSSPSLSPNRITAIARINPEQRWIHDATLAATMSMPDK